MTDNAAAFGNGQGRIRVISGDENHVNASRLAALKGLRNLRTKRIFYAKEPV